MDIFLTNFLDAIIFQTQINLTSQLMPTPNVKSKERNRPFFYRESILNKSSSFSVNFILKDPGAESPGDTK